MAKILYLTYDGLTDPLGRSQVLPYLEGCAAKGHRITILSCEKPRQFSDSGSDVRALCRRSGIDWRPLPYHKSPPVLSSAYDSWMLYRAAVRLHRAKDFDVVHCRSYLPAAAGLRLNQKTGLAVLFDMRGFWPEEKTEAGAWNLRKPLFRAVYRHFKRLESDVLRASNHVISLTHAAKRQLLTRPELQGRHDAVTVIPCCVDFDHFPLAERFREEARAQLGIQAGVQVLAYVGSLGGNYMLDEMLEFFRAYARRWIGARFLFITAEDARFIEMAATRMGLSREELIVRSARRDDVPRFLAAANAGVAFKQPTFSAVACSPTKIGEMIAMGLPVVTNAGVGDVEDVLQQTGAGVVVQHSAKENYARAVAALADISADPEDIRNGARAIFDLNGAIERYSAIYEQLGSPAASLKTFTNRGAWTASE